MLRDDVLRNDVLRNQLAAEWLKARSGWMLAGMTITGILFVGLSTFGLASQAGDPLDTGATTAAAVTHDLVRNAFAMSLFAALVGCLLVTNEYRTNFLGRALLLQPRRDVLLAAKTAVAAGTGAVLGVAAVALGLVSGAIALPILGQAAVWDRETWLICVGVFVVNVISAVWGTFIGWIVRNQVLGVVSVLVSMLLVEPAVMAFLPAVGKFLPINAMGALYLDVNPELLGTLAATAVLVVWIAAGGALSRHLLDTRDAA